MRHENFHPQQFRFADALGAAASDIHFHEQITVDALEQIQWQDQAAPAAVGRASMAVDFAYRPGLLRQASDYVMPSVGMYYDHLDELTQTAPFSDHSTRGFHFCRRS